MDYQGVRAEFKHLDGKALICFFDPSYVRADAIVMHEDGTVHALMNDVQLFIGRVEDDLRDIFMQYSEISLTAENTEGHAITLKTPLFVTKH